LKHIIKGKYKKADDDPQDEVTVITIHWSKILLTIIKGIIKDYEKKGKLRKGVLI